MIQLGTVNITDRSKELMTEALQKGEIGSGSYIGQFEKELADWLGVKYVVATSNGTMADACALAAAYYLSGGKRNEVIVPALTFIAQVNAVWYSHLKPVFVDVSYDLNIAAQKIEQKITGKTLAIMPTHLLGRPAKMDSIMALAEKHGIFVIEDSCEALGSRYGNAKVGTIGNAGCFSFYVSHSITTGEGGAVVTNDDRIAKLVRSLRNHGRKSDAFEEKFLFSTIGFSAKMNSMEAIIGLGVIPDLTTYVKKRREHLLILNSILGDKALLTEAHDTYIVPHCYPVIVESNEKRQKLLIDLPKKHGIEARQLFYSIPTQSEAYAFLGEKHGSYPVAEDIGNRGLYVPCHQNLTDEEVKYIGTVLRGIV